MARATRAPRGPLPDAAPDAARRDHYQDLCALDGRILLAGEHASYIPAWQEGAALSALDAVKRLHARVLAA